MFQRNYKLECLDNIENVERFSEEWRYLVNNSSANWIFSLPEWCIAWYKSLGQGGQLRVITARNKDGRLTGLAPMWAGPASWSELKVRKGEFIGGVQADYHDFIFEKGMEADVAPVLVEGVLRFMEDVNILEFLHIPGDSPTYLPIKDYLDAKGVKIFEKKEVSPYYVMDKSYDAIEKGWRSSHRGDIRRQKKRLGELGKLELRVYIYDNDILNDLEDFFQVHTEKWHAEGFPAMFRNPGYQDLFKEMIKTIGVKGGVHFSKLTLDNKAISYHFGFVYDNRLYWYKPALKKEYENYSPGKIHISMLMEEAVKHNIKIFDFLIGDEPYKYQWGVKDLVCNTIVIQKGGVMGVIGYEWLRWGKDKVRNSLKGDSL